MVEKGILVSILLLVAFLLFLALCKLWHCWAQRRRDEQPNEVTEPLIPEDLSVGQTLRRQSVPKPNLEESVDIRTGGGKVSPLLEAADDNGWHPKENADKTVQRSTLILEVISGPSTGARVSHQSLQSSLTVGRIPQNALVLNDPEVSGKHASIRWNSQKSRWELVDMGSLNGTLLNRQSVPCTQSLNAATRKAGDAVQLANGDILTLGSTSQVLVRISNDSNGSLLSITSAPFEVGVAADPMTLRRGGKRLSMEDVCFCEWPLRGVQQFGAFCIFDGHGGAAAAEAASKFMPQKLSDILRVDARRAEVLSNFDATDILRDAFNATEEALDHEYEGCTATVLLLWLDPNNVLYAQCANVGDSACIFSVEGKYVSMTEDHRLTSLSEKSRLLEMGRQLHEGETRLCGMNIARVLGDKFLKEQDGRFSPQPFVSEVLRITKESKALAVIASDGLWDVLSQRRALQLALEAREGLCMVEGTKGGPLSAKGIAESLVNKARMLRTKDNTSVIVLDFVSGFKSSFNTM